MQWRLVREKCDTKLFWDMSREKLVFLPELHSGKPSPVGSRVEGTGSSWEGGCCKNGEQRWLKPQCGSWQGPEGLVPRAGSVLCPIMYLCDIGFVAPWRAQLLLGAVVTSYSAGLSREQHL